MDWTKLWMTILNWITRAQQLGRDIPSGNSSEQVQGYYNYLYSTYYADIPTNRATDLLWASPQKILLWSVTLILTFFLFSYTASRVHRKYGELYGATSFAGSILERNGTVSIFTWFGIIALFLSAVYLGVRYIFLGFLY